jgi:hypothetical protein
MATPQDEAMLRTENLLRDAEDALQQDRMRDLWAQWGTTIIGMALMLVVGTGAGVIWRKWEQAQNEKATSALIKLTSNQKTTAADIASQTTGQHASIAYLTKAGNLVSAGVTDTNRADIEKLYQNAATEGKNTSWGWLARWNTLRLQMDDPKADAKKLLENYEALAADKKGSELAALAYLDAAIIAGERLKDATRAIDYIKQAEKIIQPATPIASIVSDIKHIYLIRAQKTTTEPKT